jgi:predicted RNA-binding protein YlxR (DUF448 family)
MDKHERGEGHRHERRCAQTYEIKTNDELIRFVADEGGEIFPDPSARAPGRGVWISADAEILAKAVAGNAFAKSLKRKVLPNADLVERTRNALLNHCLDLLGFAKRSNQLIIGAEKALDFLRENDAGFLFEASDSSADGRTKMLSRLGDKVQQKLIGCFTMDQMSTKLGVVNCAHVVMRQGTFAKNYKAQITRLKGFVPLYDDNWVRGLNPTEKPCENSYENPHEMREI